MGKKTDKSATAENSGKNSGKKRRGNPANIQAHQFPAGVSGNPGGRPKKKPITEIYEEVLSDPTLRAEVKKAIIARLTSGRMVGAIEMKEAADRVEGKVAHPVEMDVNVSFSLADELREARQRVLAMRKA